MHLGCVGHTCPPQVLLKKSHPLGIALVRYDLPEERQAVTTLTYSLPEEKNAVTTISITHNLPGEKAQKFNVLSSWRERRNHNINLQSSWGGKSQIYTMVFLERKVKSYF